MKITLTVEQIGDLLARRPVSVNVLGYQYLIEMEPFISNMNVRYLELGRAVARVLSDCKDISGGNDGD